MIAVPRGYVLIREKPVTAVLKECRKAELLRQHILRPDTLVGDAGNSSHLMGRGPVASIPLADSENERMLVRQYLRGGLLRFINRDMYLGKRRPFRELFLTQTARDKGVPAPEMLAAISIRRAPGLYRCFLISTELDRCSDLASRLKSIKGTDPDTFQTYKENLLIHCAGVINHMHDSGLFHADLNIKNILVDTQKQDNLYVIDWDKSRLDYPLGIKARRANVLRFCRSLAKCARHGVPVSMDDTVFFLKRYWQHAPGEISKSLRLLKRSLFLHRLTWKLTTLSPSQS